MRYGHMEFCRGERSRQSGIGVAIHHHPVRFFSEDNLFELFKHTAGLCTVRGGSDAEVMLGLWQIHLGKKYIGHCRIIMLAGVHQRFLSAGCRPRP